MDEIDKIRWIKASDAPIIKTLETREEEAATFLKGQGYDLMKSADRLVSDYLSFRNTYWGQSQPVNYKLLWKMFLEDPIVYGCVNLLVEGIVGDGFKLRGGKKLHRKVLTDLLIKNEFTMVLRDLTYQMLIFGDAYLELGRDASNNSKSIKDDNDLKKAYSSEYDQVKRIQFTPKEDEKFLDGTFVNKYTCDDRVCPQCKNVHGPEPLCLPTGNEHTINKAFMADSASTGLVREFYVADASTIRIDYNEHGETIKYIQRVLHRRVDFYPTEMIHFSINNVGGRVYGHSPLQSVIETLQAKQAAERFNSDYFRRGAIPRMAWFIPNLNDAQVKRFKEQLSTLQPQQDIVVTSSDPGMKAEQIMPTNADIQFRELLGYYKKNIIAAIGAPPVFLGEMEGANRSNAQIQLESFDRKIRTMKNSIADKINKQLLTKENFGFEDVIFEFNEDNNREELRDAQTASLLTSMTNIIDEQGRRLVLLDEVRAKLKLPPLDETYEEHEVLPMSPEQQQQMLMPQAGGDKKMPFAQRPDKYTDPNTNVDRAEHAEQQNTGAQMDSKSISPASFSSKPSSGDRRIRDSEEWATERREHPTMSDEEIDQIVTDHAIKEDLSHGKMMDPEEARLRMLRGKLFGQNLSEYPPGSVKTSNENADVSPHDVTVRDREVRNPYGATQFHVEKPENRLAAMQSERLREILQVALNPVTNAQELNTDRRFPKDSTEVPQKGLPLTHNVPPQAEAERQRNQPERDEVDAMGRTVWAANDADNQKDMDGVEADAEAREKIRASKGVDLEEAKLKIGKAVFYQDSTQLDEVDEDGGVIDQGSETAD